MGLGQRRGRWPRTVNFPFARRNVESEDRLNYGNVNANT
jgi:hypothetical protein